jgi:hypothetical protein
MTAQVGDARWEDQTGREIHIAATLSDAEGEPVEGLVPATITITRPDGGSSDFSRHAVFRSGRLDHRFPLALNAPHGEWHITVLERATGKTRKSVLTLD